VDVTVPPLTAIVLAQEFSDGVSGLLLPLVFLAFLYILLIRPQARRRKELTRLVAALQVGDLVASVGGIHGEVVDLTERTVDLAVTEDDEGQPDVIIRFDRASIVRVIEKADAPEVSDEDAGDH
jgi:preprotein translocase subunit YajC